MAYDKIITIHSRLDRRINYALNEENVQMMDSSGSQPSTSVLNTKQRWEKLSGVQGYYYPAIQEGSS